MDDINREVHTWGRFYSNYSTFETNCKYHLYYIRSGGRDDQRDGDVHHGQDDDEPAEGVVDSSLGTDSFMIVRTKR